MYPASPEPTTWSERVLRLFTDPSRRVPVLIAVAYVAAALGLAVAFLGGISDPNSDFATLGIVLLFVSFASLFYVSITVLSLEQGD